MKIVIIGAASFIGTNLTKKLQEKNTNILYLYDESLEWFSSDVCDKENIYCFEYRFAMDFAYEKIVDGADVVIHLASTVIPANSNMHIPQELQSNIISTSYLLEACVKKNVKKFVFISSGGTVYGKDVSCPIVEDTLTRPITSYGLQKLTIERMLYLYKYMFGLDYIVVRLANPFGPYQRPNGILGAVTSFTYKALIHEKIIVYGDGSIIRDYIYIDDAIKAIINLMECQCNYNVYNVGSGVGTSLNDLILTLEKIIGHKLEIERVKSRKNDVEKNILDISRYESEFGKLNQETLKEGIKKTMKFLKESYSI